MNILMLLYKCYTKITFIYGKIIMYFEKNKLGYCGKNVIIKYPNKLSNRIFLHDNVYIFENAKFIIGENGKFIMKNNSGASQGLTVITGKHTHDIQNWSRFVKNIKEKNIETTVVIEEDVSIGANVTILPCVKIHRGAQIGACSVITKSVPPYAIYAGNPAKFIRFIFTPSEIIEHEKKLYPINKRLDYNYLVKIQSIYNKK